MFEKLSDCSDILDDAIYYIGNQIKETLDVDELSHVHSAGNVSRLTTLFVYYWTFFRISRFSR